MGLLRLAAARAAEEEELDLDRVTASPAARFPSGIPGSFIRKQVGPERSSRRTSAGGTVRVGRIVASASASVPRPSSRAFGLVAGELGPQSGDRGGVIMRSPRDSVLPRAFALDPRLKSIERRGIAVNSIAMIRFSMSTTLAAIASPSTRTNRLPSSRTMVGACWPGSRILFRRPPGPFGVERQPPLDRHIDVFDHNSTFYRHQSASPGRAACERRS